MSKVHKAYIDDFKTGANEFSNNIVKLERLPREFADNSQVCDYIYDMAFDLASMSRQAGMDRVAEMLSLAAVEIGFQQLRSKCS